MRPRCSILTGGFDFSGCGDCTSCPPTERAEMSNSEPSAIVLHGIPCIGGLYLSFDSRVIHPEDLVRRRRHRCKRSGVSNMTTPSSVIMATAFPPNPTSPSGDVVQRY